MVPEASEINRFGGLDMKMGHLLLIGLLVGLITFTGCAPKENAVPPPQETQNSSQSPAPGDAAPAQADAQRTLVQQIEQNARAGKVVNCEFPIKSTNIEIVHEKWGLPDKTEYIADAKGSYETYGSRQVVFGYNKGMQIFEVRSNADSIRNLPLSKVQEVLGAPSLKRSVGSQLIIGYVVSEEIKLEFVFPQVSQDNPDPRTDHVNVLYPAGTVNSMADDPGRQW